MLAASEDTTALGQIRSKSLTLSPFHVFHMICILLVSKGSRPFSLLAEEILSLQGR